MRPGTAVATVMFVLTMHLAIVGDSASARVEQAPSSRVALDVPDGFTAARQFAGFVNEAAGTSLVVVEMPGAAYEQLASGLTPEALATKGITKSEAARLARPEPYLHMRGEQAARQGSIAKFFLVFRDKGVTALVTANVETTALHRGTITVADVERMLASATIAPSAAPARELFRLGYLGRFRHAGSIVGTTRAYTLDGKLEPAQKGETRAMVIVAPSLDDRSVGDPGRQAETLMAGLPGLSETRVVGRRPIKVAGMDAIEIVAEAKEKDGEGGVAILQVLIVPKGGGYYRIVGQVPDITKDELLPEIRRMVESFELVSK